MSKTINLSGKKVPNEPTPTLSGLDLSNTTQVVDDNGNIIFNQGVIFRKISKFLAGTDEDGLIPIQVFYNKDGKLLKDTIPPQLHEDLKDYLINE